MRPGGCLTIETMEDGYLRSLDGLSDLCLLDQAPRLSTEAQLEVMPRVGLQVPMDRKTEGLLEDRVEETRLPIGPEGDEGESRRPLIDIEVGTTPVIVRDRIGSGQLDIITGQTTPCARGRLDFEGDDRCPAWFGGRHSLGNDRRSIL